jgi:uncharacterized protein (TIGR03086 family)
MDVQALHRRAAEKFAATVQLIGDDQWSLPTPCADWDVRALVQHVVNEQRWVRPLADGATIEEVGTSLDGDLLGDDPKGAAQAAAAEAADAVDERTPQAPTVHLSFGPTPLDEYAMQVTADQLVHGWDLAAAIGADRTMDSDLVAAVGPWFAPQEEMWRQGGAIAPRPESGGDPQSDLLAAFGRDAGWSP